MKILVLENKIRFDVQDSFNRAKKYYSKRGYELEFIFEKSKLKNPPVTFSHIGDGMRKFYTVKFPYENKHDATFIAYHSKDYDTPKDGILTSQTNGLVVSLKTNREDHLVFDWIYHTIIHEMMHILFNKLNTPVWKIQDPMDAMLVNGKLEYYYKDNDPEAPDGNFAEGFKRLKIFNNIMKYKYFSDLEVKKWKLKHEFWLKLDEIRGYAGLPCIIISGGRTEDENENVGGVKDSAHLKGLGVDISIPNSMYRYRYVTAALKAGVTRIGINKTTIHLDIDPDLPRDVMWTYY